MAVAIGIDLGGTNIKGVLLRDTGEIIHQTLQSTEVNCRVNRDGQHWKRAVFEMISDLKSKSTCAVDAIGLAAPGLPDDTNSAIRVMPERLKGIENFVWKDYLKETKVFVLNDAHAALIAEVKFGVGQNDKNIIMLTWGTGVGGALLINGELYQGNYQMAGHLGHMVLNVDNEDTGITGMPGTLENAIGDATIGRRSFGRYSSTHELVKAYREGDPFATYIWLNSLRKLALGLTSLCNLLSPNLIILGGGITKAGKSLFKPLSTFIDVYEWKNTGKKTPIRQAQFYDMAGAVGAAGFALDNVLFGKLK